VTQEVFLRVFQGLPTFSFRCRFTTWLLQVTKNRALEELRTRRGRPLQVALDDVVPSLWIVDAPAERAETLAAMWQAIEGLSSDLKAPLLLRDVAGLSYLEIADSLDVTLATVKWRIFKARERVLLACREEVSAKPGR
jgi:RNA polymerase sigma-70 factor (ECF subfamily)